MPPVHLPVTTDHPIDIEGELAEQLEAFLAPLNAPGMQARVGQEEDVEFWHDDRGYGRRYQAERYRHTDGWVQTVRYVFWTQGHHPDPTQPADAAVQVVQAREGRQVTTRISNIYVQPDLRRQGLARHLVQRIQRDHPRLMVDSSLSKAGAALFGVKAENAPVSAAARSRLPRTRR